jgi:phage shock protein PspC (stress-responsive transcriptional regulator)
MNENPTIAEPLDPAPGGVSTAAPPPPPPPQPAPAAPVRPPLRRSRQDRVLSGVLGGIGRQYDVDPVLLRILVVVATIFTGGAVAIGYVVAWVLIPDEPAYLPVVPTVPAGTVPPSYAAGGTGTFVDPATGQVFGATVVAPLPPPRRTEPRSYLGLITLSVAVIVGGLLAVLGVSGVSVPAVVVAAAMLGVLGIGLLVGSFRGRARWLIAPAVILLLVAQIAAVVPKVVSDTAGSGIGERRWAPTASSTSFELGAGSATLDLSTLPSGPVEVDATIGVGELIVLVPADTRLVLDGSVGVGEIDLPGSRPQSGSDLDVQRTIEPLTTTSDITTVELTAEVGLGNLEVRRATS